MTEDQPDIASRAGLAPDDAIEAVTVTDEVLTGPVRTPCNDARDVKGSIHDDETATDLGFRGGTVAGSVHMDQFVPVLLRAFGLRWFETGSLSLYFRYATTDREPVRAFAAAPPVGAADTATIPVWMNDGDKDHRVAAGTASAVGVVGAELQTRDLRAGDPEDLAMLHEVAPGHRLPATEVDTTSLLDDQRAFFASMTEPLSWYTGGPPRDGPVACLRSLVHLLFLTPAIHLGRLTGPAVGLFGAIEIEHLNGPLLLGPTYTVDGEVIAVGESPKTEYVWFDSRAVDADGVPIARMRMLLRYLKASSPLFAIRE